MDKMRVLIVDDSCAIQTIIRRSLEKITEVELETRQASDGDQAFDIARSWEPDLIVTDWHMPNMNGLELLQAVNREMLGIKVGFVTAESSTSLLDQAQSAGAKFILNKPFASEALNARVLPALREETQVTVCDDADTLKDSLKDRRNDDPESDTATDTQRQQANQSEALTDLTDSPFDLVDEPQHHGRIGSLAEITATLLRQCNLSVAVQKIAPVDLSTIAPPFMLGFYSAGNNAQVSGLCLMDMACVLSLGGVVSNVERSATLSALKQKRLPQQHVVGSELIATVLGDCVTDDEISPSSLSLSKANVISRISPKLKKLLDTPASERLDMKIASANYGHGRMILIAC